MNPVERTRESNRKPKKIASSIIKYAALDSVAVLILVLGLYGKLVAQGNAFHPFLNDPGNATALIVIGAIGMALCGFKIMMLVLPKGKNKRSI